MSWTGIGTEHFAANRKSLNGILDCGDEWGGSNESTTRSLTIQFEVVPIMPP